jgi:hypothetical protein
MKLIPYTAGNAKSHQQVGKELQLLKAGEYIIEVKKNRPVRSLSQNKYYWALIEIVASSTGHTKREIEYAFKMERCVEVIELPGGRTKEIPKDTKDMDTTEFASVLNNLQQWIRETFPELIIPRKEDLNYMQYMKISRDYNNANAGF